MKRYKKILLIWLSSVASFAVLMAIFRYGPQASPMVFVINSFWLLLGVLSIFLVLNEPNPTVRPVFFNFSLFTLYAAGATLYFFVGARGSVLSQNPFSSVYCFQYLTAFYCFLLAFCIVYVVIDALFANFRVFQKYLSTFLIVGAVFAYYFSSLLGNPDYLYSTADIQDFRVVSKRVDALNEQGIQNPTAQQIASNTTLSVWNDGKPVGALFEDQKLSRIAELLPYLEGENYVLLVYRPLFLNIIYVSVLCIVFIFLFFGYQYKNDPPQGAYIEKIVFLFLPYCSLEVLHNFAYIKSVQVSTFGDILQIGQYLSLTNLVMLTVFFGLRLRFITSVKGEFYERELVSDAEHISRWRDALDNLVVRHFLNPKAIHGRLFAPRTPRNEA